jgi:hypothetical protein
MEDPKVKLYICQLPAYSGNVPAEAHAVGPQQLKDVPVLPAAELAERLRAYVESAGG